MMIYFYIALVAPFLCVIAGQSVTDIVAELPACAVRVKSGKSDSSTDIFAAIMYSTNNFTFIV
jgi:predicted transcriptional regulator